MQRSLRLLPYVGAVALVLLLLSQIQPQDVISRLLDANPIWLLVGCGWYLCTNILRAYRIAKILVMPGLRKPLNILPEMFALSFLNNVLPSRTGELSFPFFMAQRHQTAVGTSTAALLIVRIFDYLAVAILFTIFALIERPNLAPAAAQVVSIVTVVLAATVVGLIAMPWLGQVGLSLVRWLFKRFGLEGNKVSALVDRFGTQIVTTLALMRSPTFYLQTVAWSLAIWLCTFAWFAAFMQAIGLPYRYTLVIVGATFGSLAKAMPIPTIGGFGAYEAGWTVGFGLTGMARDTAISSGFAVNILILATSIIFGGSALVYMTLSRRKDQQDTSSKESFAPDDVLYEREV